MASQTLPDPNRIFPDFFRFFIGDPEPLDARRNGLSDVPQSRACSGAPKVPEVAARASPGARALEIHALVWYQQSARIGLSGLRRCCQSP